eukprot:3314559-Rhodomonas_salina.2
MMLCAVLDRADAQTTLGLTRRSVSGEGGTERVGLVDAEWAVQVSSAFNVCVGNLARKFCLCFLLTHSLAATMPSGADTSCAGVRAGWGRRMAEDCRRRRRGGMTESGGESRLWRLRGGG